MSLPGKSSSVPAQGSRAGPREPRARTEKGPCGRHALPPGAPSRNDGVPTAGAIVGRGLIDGSATIPETKRRLRRLISRGPSEGSGRLPAPEMRARPSAGPNGPAAAGPPPEDRAIDGAKTTTRASPAARFS
ncbi:conserved hypothetical protein [Ixodes scapularis]|uniref:Uncharacterized protein n=1 Tax=Ixodes scapularis TaxID=6945 RepID=B7PLS4_IXOSC|nr:conserved hypothetical protein [Ixodes scapularis]|eukprot:XP_002434722.1 conserved hypothetical protein [Ixodes scapularis]